MATSPKHRFLFAPAVLLVTLLAATLAPATAWGDTIDGVSYVDASGVAQTPVTCTVIDASDETWGDDGNDGWYVVQGSVTIDSRVSVSGNVNLILADGCSLMVNESIIVDVGTSLTIWSQSGGTGSVTATGNTDDSGIGGRHGFSSGTITINGGTVSATGTYDAGIGSGSSGTIIINGGTVNATSNRGAGIGGDGNSSSPGGGTITINGGTVNATSISGAGIGGGIGGSGGTITITGGAVTASGTGNSAGIGGGNKGGAGGTVRISGGVIHATGSGAGAGIGGGLGGDGGTVSITGGMVYATGGMGTSEYGAGAGIGGGGAHSNGYPNPGSAANATVSGNAVVFATGGKNLDNSEYDAPAIGSGASWEAGGTSSTGSGGGFSKCIVFENATGKVYNYVELSADFTIDATQTLEVTESAFFTFSQGTLTNNGTLINKGYIGTSQFVNAANATLTNSGVLDADQLTNAATIVSTGAISVYVQATNSGSLKNDGTLFVARGAAFENAGTLEGGGAVEGEGTFTTAPGGVYTLKVTRSIEVPVLDGSVGASSFSVAVPAIAPANGAGDGVVQYAISTTNTAPTDARAWSTGDASGKTFTDLDANTTYYVFARVTEGDIYGAAGPTSALEVTTAARTLVVTDLSVALPKDAVYDGTPKVVQVNYATGSSANATTSGAITVLYGTSADPAAATPDAPVAAGTYYVFAKTAGGTEYYDPATIEVSTFSIAKRTINLTNATLGAKTYDGTAAATVESVTFDGLVAGESLMLGTDFVADAAFDDAAAGTGKKATVEVKDLATTGVAANYQLGATTLVLVDQTVGQLVVEVTGVAAENRAYDGTLGVNLSGGALSGVLATDVANVGFSLSSAAGAGQGTMADADAGVGKAVSFNIALFGTAADNYRLDSASGSAVVDIAPATLAPRSFTFTPPANLVADGTPKVATVQLELPDGTSGAGDVVVRYEGTGDTVYSSADAPTQPGTYRVLASTVGGTNFQDVEDMEVGTFAVTAAPAPAPQPDDKDATPASSDGGDTTKAAKQLVSTGDPLAAAPIVLAVVGFAALILGVCAYIRFRRAH